MSLPGTTVRKRPVWPWFVGSIGALLLLAVGVGIGVVLTTASQKEADLKAVEQAVRDFDTAFEEIDCDLLESVTSEDLLDELYEPDGYECDAWEQNTEKFFDDDGDYTFDVDVLSVRVTGDRARVDTAESWEVDGEEFSGTVTYRLERQKGAWLITEYEDELDESDEPSEPEPEPEPDCGSDEADGCGVSDPDTQVSTDLSNTKTALIAYFVETGSFDGIDAADLSAYGFTRSDETDDLTYIIPDDSVESFCVEARSSSGLELVITSDTDVAEGRCSDLGF